MAKRVYLVIMDESDEARLALRYASRRAAGTMGEVHILAVLPRQDFVAWGSVQATMEEEARSRAEVMVMEAAGNLFTESGQQPAIAVKQGDAAEVVRDYLSNHPEVAVLVLATAANGAPGPLVSHFTGPNAGTLPCPLFVVPGSLSTDDIDRLS